MSKYTNSIFAAGLCLSAVSLSAGDINKKTTDLLQSLSANRAFQDTFSSIIPGALNDHVVIGTAYNSTSNTILNNQPVSGRVVTNYGSTSSNISYSNSASYTDILRMLNGSVDASANFSSVKVSAGAHIAKSTAASNYSSSYTFSNAIVPKSKTFLPNNADKGFMLSPVGQDILNVPSEKLESYVGDEFITQINYGASIFVNMTVDFLSERDKRDIGGYLSVDVLGGVVNVKGELNFLDEEAKESVKITVRAIQKGGEPKNLLSIIPENIITCSLRNPDPCFSLFKEAIRYARNDFGNQFNQLSSYNVTSYKTKKYVATSTDVAQLSPFNKETDAYRDLLLADLTEWYQEQLIYEKRASDLLSKYYAWMPEEQKDRVKAIKKSAYQNAWLYYDAANYCLDHPYGDLCKNYWENREQLCETNANSCIVDITPSSLNVPTQDRKFYQCELARQRATDFLGVSEKVSLAYRNLRWAPVYNDVSDPYSDISEWTTCDFAITTYGREFES